MREICARLEKMEARQRRAPDAGDVIEEESEEVEFEEVAGEDNVEEHLLKVAARLGGRAKIEVPMYEGNQYVEELLD